MIPVSFSFSKAVKSMPVIKALSMRTMIRTMAIMMMMMMMTQKLIQITKMNIAVVEWLHLKRLTQQNKENKTMIQL